MTKNGKSIFESLWFNAIMSVVAIAALIEKVINQSYYHDNNLDSHSLPFHNTHNENKKSTRIIRKLKIM